MQKSTRMENALSFGNTRTHQQIVHTNELILPRHANNRSGEPNKIYYKINVSETMVQHFSLARCRQSTHNFIKQFYELWPMRAGIFVQVAFYHTRANYHIRIASHHINGSRWKCNRSFSFTLDRCDGSVCVRECFLQRNRHLQHSQFTWSNSN